MDVTDLTPGIVYHPEICGGQPHIKGKRFAVWLILEWLEAGKSFDDILEAYEILTREDISAAINYAKSKIKGTEIRRIEVSP